MEQARFDFLTHSGPDLLPLGEVHGRSKASGVTVHFTEQHAREWLEAHDAATSIPDGLQDYNEEDDARAYAGMLAEKYPT
jgi:hypothetical protein